MPPPNPPQDPPSERELTGRWVTSYSGFMLFDPPQPLAATQPLPPQLACVGYKPTTDTTGTYSQREGYFLIAAVACFVFRRDGSLEGTTFINRGGKGFLKNEMTGHYVQDPVTDLEIRGGVITTHHFNTGNIDVENTYKFIMKSKDEIEWIHAGSSFRGVVAHGTMTRISHP